MVTIDEVESEVVVDNATTTPCDDADQPVEVRIEELRAVVRELIEEEFSRFRRIEAAR